MFHVQAAHLTRHYAADVFLDSFEYGAHTSTSDALSSGLPVLTLDGSSFASRVSSSLMSHSGSVGPSLVTATVKEYVSTALQLSGSPHLALAARLRLLNELFPVDASLSACTPPFLLFRPQCFTRGFEVAALSSSTLYEVTRGDTKLSPLTALRTHHIVVPYAPFST